MEVQWSGLPEALTDPTPIKMLFLLTCVLAAFFSFVKKTKLTNQYHMKKYSLK